MARVFISLIFLFSFLAIPVAEAREVPKEAFTFDFNVTMLKTERWRENKIHNAIELLRRVFASPEFKRKILNHDYYGRKMFDRNMGLSNWQIYRRILRGMEKLNPYPNNAMDLEIQFYTDYNSIVLGFTRPNTHTVWINNKYFNKRKPAQIAASLVHEWLHKVGFGHEFQRTENRNFSVPYGEKL